MQASVAILSRFWSAGKQECHKCACTLACCILSARIESTNTNPLTFQLSSQPPRKKKPSTLLVCATMFTYHPTCEIIWEFLYILHENIYDKETEYRWKWQACSWHLGRNCQTCLRSEGCYEDSGSGLQMPPYVEDLSCKQRVNHNNHETRHCKPLWLF